MEEKRFDEWNEVKEKLHHNNKIIDFHEREVWWYAAGENLGREINGKDDMFSRPILVIRKYGKESFFGIPLSTSIRSENYWFSNVEVDGEIRSVLLSQAGSYSSCRLYSKIGRVKRATDICTYNYTLNSSDVNKCL